eukprot:5458199-Pyramimonas_sp.AAC.1
MEKSALRPHPGASRLSRTSEHASSRSPSLDRVLRLPLTACNVPQGVSLNTSFGKPIRAAVPGVDPPQRAQD